jgi:hypothetical protein
MIPEDTIEFRRSGSIHVLEIAMETLDCRTLSAR